MIKSPIAIIGGKGMLVGWLSQFIPQHVCYAEVFAGGASLLFGKPASKVEILNDCDSLLIEFFKAIKNPQDRQCLTKELELLPYSRMIWQTIRTRWKEGNRPLDYIKCLAQWYYLNRTSFAGDSRNGGFAALSITGRNPCQTFRSHIDNFDAIAERLRNVCIENLPYGEVIRRYDSPDSFFYIDSPYVDAEHYYGDSFTENDHYKLAELLHNIKGKCMVSHYANSLYDDLYKGWQRYEYQSFKGSHKAYPGDGKPVTTEILYTNFKQRKGLFNV